MLSGARIISLSFFLTAAHAVRTLEQRNIQANGFDDVHSKEYLEENIGRCVNPENSRILVNNPQAWKDLVWQKVDRETPLIIDAWKHKSFEDMPWLAPVLPYHHIMGLVRNASKYPKDETLDSIDSECFSFDYSDPHAPDPADCRVFAASFAPLKELRNCIVEELDKDNIWTTRRDPSTIIKDGKFQGAYDDWCHQAVWSRTGPMGIIDVHMCALQGGLYDSIRRAEEMIKYTLNMRKEVSPAEIPAWVAKKAQFSVTWPRGQDGLEANTVSAISQKCFNVKEDGVESAFWSLQRIGTCLPLMYDKAEISIGVTDATVKWMSKDMFTSMFDMKESSTYPVRPACGRMALATIPSFQTAPYTVAQLSTFKMDSNPAWASCVDVRSSNCRKVHFCWEKALNRICGLSSECCPDRSEVVQEACAVKPDGRLIPEKYLHPVLVDLTPGGNWFGWQGKCTGAMKTGRWTSYLPDEVASCSLVDGATSRIFMSYPNCKCSSRLEEVYCRGQRVADSKFDLKHVSERELCQTSGRPRCAQGPSCNEIDGATSQDNEDYPKCKCIAKSDSVMCEDEVLAARYFDAALVLSGSCKQPRCGKPMTTLG